MGSLSSSEADTIVRWFNRVAAALNLAAAQPGVPADRIDELTGLSERVADQAANIATHYAQAQFANADAAFRQISDAAAKADATARALASDVTKAEKIVDIGTTLVGLGAAVVTGNYAKALSDVIALVGTPVPGSGAAVPATS